MFNMTLAIAMSLAIQSVSYDFECGYEIDGILIHEGTPRNNGGWDGYAHYGGMVIRHGLSDINKMIVFTHERFHYERMKNGTFDRNNRAEEERLANLYAWNESNWDRRILRFSCVEE